MSAAPASGGVLGIDIGYSPTRATGAVCHLSWTAKQATWSIGGFRFVADERRAAISTIAGNEPVLCAAFDGPFRAALDTIGIYRAAERVLTRNVARDIGKPGPSHVPNGRLLNDATNAAVRDVLAVVHIPMACRASAIPGSAVVEGFPNAFLGVMLADDHGLAKGRGGKSDRYYICLGETGRLDKLTAALLPGRALAQEFMSVINHDDRAALVCALSALCVVAGRYVAVGDDNGRIILPPTAFWNSKIRGLVRKNCEAEAPSAWIERF